MTSLWRLAAGIVTLAATILRALRRGHANAFRRRCDLARRIARPF